VNILSISSNVASGHVGNAAAVFAMQRLGHEVWPIDTLRFSNHPGHGRWRGRATEPGLIDEIVAGLADLGVLAACDGVITGYAGTGDAAAAMLRAVAAVKLANPTARVCCDPVLGDDGRLYVPADVATLLVAAGVPAADVVTPNLFELGVIAGHTVQTHAELAAALDAAHRLGPAVVLVTSANVDTTPAGCVDCVVSSGEGRFLARTTRLDTAVHGAGDAMAALFFAQWLATGSAVAALAHATAAVHGVLRATAASGAPELLLVAAQAELVAPSQPVVPQPFRSA
jgi:pyridoxine kinase